ncbi:aspartate-semialdehyde dehydrogenase [Mangrovihabitans endophyticus]|uniref:aspartate-semialdehyde dehydrogenase n=1 Tax=Mangrovihabitans endophyticus TaxID=1751298 RepID=A0A8J3C5B9_9ACTN|nr:aspartate-semialdehyde dehydrogenase [Mangrovihabitans endophyticus]GGL11549.1 aspartate-semialdehyde dehydrogenase [Mangrovihabitans endophyticus]
MAQPTLAVVGADRPVGTVMRELLSSRRNVWGEVRLVSLDPAAGVSLPCRGVDVPVSPVAPEIFDGVDVAIFDVPEPAAEYWAPVAVERGVTVVDGSAAFRMAPDVPLVVPEVNRQAVRRRPRGIVSGANCTTTSMLMAVAPLHHEYGLRELTLASYQAVSGAGQVGVDVLHDQISKLAGDRTLGSRPGDVRQAVGDDLGPFRAPMALNVVPWIGDLTDGGWSSEEREMRNESRKILGLPDLKVSATCVRVPVVTGHSIAVHAVFGAELSADEARKVLRNAPGVILVDDPEADEFPMPVDAVGTDPSWVGRIRRAMDDPRALDFFVTGDNMRKGSALNTVQIAELVAMESERR